MKQMLSFILLVFSFQWAHAQDAAALIEKLKAKIAQVNDYQAAGVMKTNVPFLKVPVADVMVYFKSPDKLKIKNEKGISLVPKSAVGISLSNLMTNRRYQAIPGGTEMLNGKKVKVIRLLPVDHNSEVVLSTLYIDEPRLLILKAVTTTRENGTYELEMEYGRFADYALPSKAIFTFNTKEYKLPKGVTFDYDDGTDKKKNESTAASTRGRVEISYNTYVINKGIPDTVFK